MTDQKFAKQEASAQETGRDPTQIACRECGAEVGVGFRFCGVCGAAMNSQISIGPAFRDPMIGALIGDRYRVIERLGTGGMGAVYKVEHAKIGKIAAMKLLHGDLSRDEEMVRRFNREARAVSKLHSPHTVSVFDYGRSAGLIYLVMEYLQGIDLADLQRDVGPLPPERVASFVQQIAISLSEAHGLGIVHRDLKPENIYLVRQLNGEETIKVLDFGLAKLVENREDSVAETKAGTILGTPYYMSPEQIRSKPVDARTDIYALGAVVFRLLTGKPPFKGEGAMAVLQMHLSDPVPSLTEYKSQLALVDPVIRKAMAKKPKDRYASVEDFAYDLDHAVRGISGIQMPVMPPVAPAPTTTERMRVGTRREFDHFETGLRVRRFGSSLFAFLCVAALAYVSYWGFVQGNFKLSKREHEPNEDQTAATRVAVGAPVTGFMGNGAAGGHDRDTFVFEFDNDDAVAEIVVSGVPGIDLIIETLDVSGRRLAVVDGAGEGEPEVLRNQRVSRGLLYVIVRQDGNGRNVNDPYTLQANQRAALVNEESELVAGPRDAPSLTTGETLSGMVSYPGDIDLFALPTVSADNVQYTIELNASATQNLSYAIIDRDERVVMDDIGTGTLQTVNISNAEYPRPHAIRIHALDPLFSDDSVYELTVNAISN